MVKQSKKTLWKMVTADQLALPNIPKDLNRQNINTFFIKKLRIMLLKYITTASEIIFLINCFNLGM